MMPRAKLLVYMVVNGEFVYDEQVIHFEENLLNAVSYSLHEYQDQIFYNVILQVQIEAPIRAPPGQDIDIGISTKPYSYVGLMVVDQNAAALRSGKFNNETLNSSTNLIHNVSPSGNDLTHDRLMDALQSYELSDVNTPVGSPGKESGVITMSNTDYFVEKGK